MIEQSHTLSTNAPAPRLYPWQIIASLSVAVFVLMGISLYSFIFLSSALADERHWSATQSGSIVSAMWLVAPLALFCAPIIKRFGPWPLIVIGVAAQAACLLGMVHAGTFAELYVLRVLMGVGKVLLMVAAPVIIAQYFKVGFGTALSVFWAFASASGLFMGPLTEHLIGTLGWRGAALALAAIAMAGLPVTAILALAGRKGYLARIGSYAAATPSDTAATAPPDGAAEASWGALIASLGAGTVLITGLAIFGTGVTAVALFSHIGGLVKEAGFDAAFLGELVGILSITAVIGGLMIGWMMDRVPAALSTLVISGMVCLGMAAYFLLLRQPSPMAAILGTASLGLGLAGGELMWINLVRRAVAPGLFSVAYSGWYFAIQIGYASGGALTGLSLDHFHSLGLLVTMLAIYAPAMIMSLHLARGPDRSKLA